MVRRRGWSDKNGLKKGAWTAEEDRKLISYVTRYGCWNWRQLPKYAGLARCGKSCRLRWMNYLRPNIKRGNFTREEDDTIIRLHSSLGNRWSAIAAQLPGRTDNEIKNHWHTTLKKLSEKKSESDEEKPRKTAADKEKYRELEPDYNYKDHSVDSTTSQIDVDCVTLMSPHEFSASDHQQSSSITTGYTQAVHVTNSDRIPELADEMAHSAGNFWTQPFFADDNAHLSSSKHDFLVPFDDSMCFSPHQFSLYYDGELW